MLANLPYRELLQVLVQNNWALKMTYFTTALNYQHVTHIGIQLEMKTNMWNSLNSIITFLLVWWRSSPWRNCVSNLFTYWQNKVTVQCSQHVWLLTALWVNLSKGRPIGQFVQGLTGLWVNMFKGKQVCGSTCPRVNRSVVQHVQG